jgi:hypothetical protein
MSAAGLVGEGVIGYVLFDDSIGFGVSLGVGVALVLGIQSWRIVHDPTRAAELTHESRSQTALHAAVTRVALPFVALGIATVVGVAMGSLPVFFITFAAGLAVGFALRHLVHG